MASSRFARSATASAFSRFHHQDWRPTNDQTPARHQVLVNAVMAQVAPNSPTRRIWFSERNPLAGQPRRVRAEIETLCGEPMHSDCDRSRPDNDRQRPSHRARHFNRFEAELHELDMEQELAVLTLVVPDELEIEMRQAA